MYFMETKNAIDFFFLNFRHTDTEREKREIPSDGLFPQGHNSQPMWGQNLEPGTQSRSHMSSKNSIILAINTASQLLYQQKTGARIQKQESKSVYPHHLLPLQELLFHLHLLQWKDRGFFSFLSL